MRRKVSSDGGIRMRRRSMTAIFARRYLFLGDARMLQAELRIRTAMTPPVRKTLSKVREIEAEDRPQIKDADICR